jgi:AbrB family transcriptional regulator (stage V sporulation protein T)
MKETGILRRIDDLGRIVIPKEIRKKLKIREGDNLDIFVEEEKIVLQKYSPIKDLGKLLEIMLYSLKSTHNVSFIVTDLNKVISSSFTGIKEDDLISERFIQTISKKEKVEINKSMVFNVTNSYISEKNLVIEPIIVYGDLFGAIVLFSDYEVLGIKLELLELLRIFITEYLES